MTRTVANTDIAGTAALLMSRFSGRPDVYLVEQYGRTWTEKKPLTDNVLISHIKGERRVGRFPIEHGRTTWVCWDFDCQDPEMVKPLVNLCAKWGLPVTVERSREKGYHVWLLLSEPVPAAMAREVGLTLMRAAGLECEVFPKQDDLNANEFGNAVFLPWQGISVTKNRTVFIDPQTLETYTDQVSHLRFHERLSTEWFEYVSDLCRPGVEQSPCNPLVEQAISKATNGTRNDIGFELAIISEAAG